MHRREDPAKVQEKVYLQAKETEASEETTPADTLISDF